MKFRHYNDISDIAIKFLKKHHSSFEIPIPIEEIAEFRLKFHIVPHKNLFKKQSIDAFLSSDLLELHIDEDHYMGQTNRCRFTIAHEIGHFVLHKEMIPKFKNLKEWKKFILETQSERAFCEYQANDFAGCLLVPKNLVLAQAKSFRKKSTAKVSLKKSLEDFNFIAHVAKTFDVSEQVAEIRLSKLLKYMD